MKSLKFWDPLPDLILKGEKTVTWRVNDEKNIEKNDRILLCRKDGTIFAKAVVVKVKKTKFKYLNLKSKGHEKFSSKQNMYKKYSEYYGFPVVPDTPVKIITFKLVKDN